MRSTQDGDIYFCNAKPIINFRIIFLGGGGLTIVFNGRASLNKSTLVPRNASSNAQSRLELWWHFFAIFRRIFWHFSYKELLRFRTKKCQTFRPNFGENASVLDSTVLMNLFPKSSTQWLADWRQVICVRGQEKGGSATLSHHNFFGGKKVDVCLFPTIGNCDNRGRMKKGELIEILDVPLLCM
jgi:hypothetical protein